MIIVSLSFCIGVGLTQTSGNFFSAFPQAVGDIFNGKCGSRSFCDLAVIKSVSAEREENKIKKKRESSRGGFFFCFIEIFSHSIKKLLVCDAGS